jgi:murein DD-endopeptidase MepM/ murein hydrolase activator NlpD
MTVTTIIQALVPQGRKDRPGTKLKATSVTIHNTFNSDRGANAAAHARALVNGSLLDEYIRSWHFTVDDVSIYQHIPISEVAYHAGRGNATSLGVEICENKDMNDSAAYDNAAWLVANLLLRIGQTPKTGMKQHFDWTGKDCPHVLRGRKDGWKNFIAAVTAKFNAMQGMQPTAGIRAAGRGRASARGAATAARVSAKATVLAVRRHEASALAAAKTAKPIPAGKPLRFAALAAGPCYWPVVSTHPMAHVVPADFSDGTATGGPFRRFLAPRPVDGPQARYHVGVDIAANEGDTVLAIQPGKIVAFYPFFTRRNDEVTYALFVAHEGYVANYGEVQSDSLAALGLKIGDDVAAGRPIARVSGTRMIHFETYVTGTRENKRWPLGGKAPAQLLNPTQLLLDLQANGLRLDPEGFAMPPGEVRAFAYETYASPRLGRRASDAMPYPKTSDWHRPFEFGREWRYDARGVYTRDVHGGTRPWRWETSLTVMKRIWELMGDDIERAAVKHGVNPALIMMTIATETHFAAEQGFTGPKTFRWEAHVDNDDVTPPFKGDYSPGPMQTLGTTVRWVIRAKGKDFDLAYAPFKVAPVYRTRPVPPPKSHPLYDYATNLDIGTAEIRIRINKTGDDPILVAAAYNRGSLRKDPDSDWGLQAHGDHLDRAAKWYGDACALLSDLGIF